MKNKDFQYFTNRLMVFLVVMTMGLDLLAQSVSLRFSGTENNGNFIELHQVVVANISQGWQEILTYPDTLLIMNNVSSVEESTNATILMQNWPNPFKGNSHFILQTPIDGIASLVVFDMMGHKILETEQYLTKGKHQFNLQLSVPQAYLLNVQTTLGASSIKLINYGESGDNQITYEGTIATEIAQSKSRGTTDHLFDPGDLMSFVGFALVGDNMIESETITRSMCGSEDIELAFDLNQDWPVGALKHRFSVGPATEVYFSRGNLQYHAADNVWRFAMQQYNCENEANANIGPSYNGWIDLFGWGTSGYDGCLPYLSEQNSYAYGNSSGNISYTEYDWGMLNTISNGGNQAGIWRTLTAGEWSYLFNSRVNASDKYGSATIEGVHGLVVLPDEWTLPEGAHFNAGMAGYDSNTYTIADWQLMNDAGAMFLPAACFRFGNEVHQVNKYGYYWSGTLFESDDYFAYCLTFGGSSFNASDYYYRYGGLSVRLVLDY